MGPLIGPTLGGWMVEYLSWHWIFLINLPIGLLGALITFKAMPNITEPTVQRFDFGGFILLVIAMIGLCLGLKTLPIHNIPLVELKSGRKWPDCLTHLRLPSHTHLNALFAVNYLKIRSIRLAFWVTSLPDSAATRFRFYCL